MPRAENKIWRIGVIGCGHWGKNYLRTFDNLSETSLVAFCDKNKSRLKTYAALYPEAKRFSSAEELLESNECDAVIISTLATTHYDLVKRALEAGLDVLVEKPFTLRVEEAEDLAARAKAKRRILMIAHTFLFNPAIRQMKQYLDEGLAGKIYYAKARRTHLGLVREDVNAVWDLAPHDISIFLYLFGKMPSRVQALGRRILRKDREDVAFINLAFPGGVIAHIGVSWTDSNKERYIDVVGSKCRIAFDDLNMQEPIRIFNKGVSVEQTTEDGFGEFKYLFRDGDIVSPMIPVQEPLRNLCEAFVEALETRKVTLSDAAFGCQVVRTLVRIDEELNG